MGVGGPYYPVICHDDAQMIYPPTIEKVLDVFGVSKSDYLKA